MRPRLPGHVDRVGAGSGALPVGSHTVDLVDKDDHRVSLLHQLGECSLKQVGGVALTIAEHLARERVGINLGKEDLAAYYFGCESVGNTSDQAGLAGARLAAEQGDAVDRKTDDRH